MFSEKFTLNHILIVFVIIFFSASFVFNFSVKGEQQYSYLATSFLHGKTYFLNQPGSWWDAVSYNGKYYWPPSPFPAVLLMPFVLVFNLFHIFFYQGFLQFFLEIGVFVLCFKITRKYKYSYYDSLFLAFGFCFSSTFLGIALWPWSWQFSQIVTVFLVFLSIYEYLGKRRYWLIGIFYGLIGATRIASLLGLLFFVLSILFLDKKINGLLPKIKNIIYLTLFPFFIFILLLIYNFARFGNFLEQGYSRQIVPDFHSLARSYGMLSLQHLPRNLYYFLIKTPDPVFEDSSRVLKFPFIKADRWGMSIFVTTPFLVYMFFLKFKDKMSKILLLTSLFIAIPIFLLYSSGSNQFGYRYALEFLPFLFFLLIRNYFKEQKRISFKFKLLILASSLVNFFLFITTYFQL